MTLSSDHLEVIPEIVKSYEFLEELDLGFNKITRLPHWFGHLSQLEKLDLSGNPLMTIPEEIFSLKNLKTLIFRAVPITALPRQLLDLPLLSTLFIPETFATDPIVIDLTNRGVHVACRNNFW